MGFRRFEVLIVMRVLLLVLVIGMEAYVIFRTEWLISQFILAVLIVLLTYDLIRYVKKTNRDLSSFLESIRHHDFTASFSSGRRGSTYDQLKDAFNEIIREFRRLEAEKESHHHYLQTVIENVQVALICFEATGEVMLMNQAAKELLAKPYIKRIGALEKIDEQLMKVIGGLRSGERELIKVVVKGDLLQIAVQVTEFRLMDKDYTLVTLQDIRTELDRRELEAWQKLIRVLTHEIMNSVTPVSTLSGVMRGMVTDEEDRALAPEALTADTLEDLALGLRTIETRSQGLLRFVSAYRSLVKVPQPHFQLVEVQDLLLRISTLLRNDLQQRHIHLDLTMPREPLMVQLDPELVEQVLINLVKNAMEALGETENPQIELVAARPQEHRTVLQVRDNGPGIEDEFLEQIFVPFFTTKKEGSGIGLSLSRQIMQLHKGSITVNTEPGSGTIFTLEF